MTGTITHPLIERFPPMLTTAVSAKHPSGKCGNPRPFENLGNGVPQSSARQREGGHPGRDRSLKVLRRWLVVSILFKEGLITR